MLNKKAYALGASRSCIRELFECGQQRKREIGEENVLDFSLGNPSIPTPVQVDRTLEALLSTSVHGYTSAVGDWETRQAIADNLNRRYDAGVKPENLFLGCGAAAELTAVFGALAIPQGEIVAIAPYFPEYRPFVEGCGMTLQVVKADIPAFQIDWDALEQVLNSHTQAVIVNSPNNPAGTVYSRETLEKLGALLRKKSMEFGHPIYIVADEPYRELAYDGVEVPFIPTIYPDTVVCYSYSKSLSLPGERIGYVYVPEGCTESKALYTAICGAARERGHVCAPSMMQKMLARCAELTPDLQSYDRNRKALYQGLVQAGYTVAKPQGAFYLFVKAPDGNSKAFSQLAKKRDVLVVPGDDFGCPEYFRLCYCIPYEKIMKSLPVFCELIKHYESEERL